MLSYKITVTSGLVLRVVISVFWTDYGSDVCLSRVWGGEMVHIIRIS